MRFKDFELDDENDGPVHYRNVKRANKETQRSRRRNEQEFGQSDRGAKRNKPVRPQREDYSED